MSVLEVFVFLALGLAIWGLCEWLLTKLPIPRPECRCDESNQGRECPNCTPPRLPRMRDEG
jgi:hypothetical protein